MSLVMRTGEGGEMEADWQSRHWKRIDRVSPVAASAGRFFGEGSVPGVQGGSRPLHQIEPRAAGECWRSIPN